MNGAQILLLISEFVMVLGRWIVQGVSPAEALRRMKALDSSSVDADVNAILNGQASLPLSEPLKDSR